MTVDRRAEVISKLRDLAVVSYHTHNPNIGRARALHERFTKSVGVLVGFVRTLPTPRTLIIDDRLSGVLLWKVLVVYAGHRVY